ncbi:hypothetical protein [Clostridium fungisolvens]|uniref:Uncharacterized protein n=1 Tax=Clostridium fungisolvens TaxID=1604897 RepID=A0A6V8SBU6_9CLOT|nr:hypothetical protein [Clostridium fungisolvens]GFP74176.1 hypothetical protein bsdtw1_00221 [Clostridium fungisolvens]
MKKVKMPRQYKFAVILYSVISMGAGIALTILTRYNSSFNNDTFTKQKFEVSIAIIVIGFLLLLYGIFFIKGYKKPKKVKVFAD